MVVSDREGAGSGAGDDPLGAARAADQAGLLALLLEHAPSAVALLDRDLRYLAVSRRYLADFRLEEATVVGRLHYEVFPEIPERWREIHRRCLAGEPARAEADPFPRADGSRDWVHWEVHPWRTASGEVGGLLLFSEVITARKHEADRLAASEARYRALFEQSAAGVGLVESGTGRFLAINDRFSAMLGYAPDELVGRHWLELTHPDDVAADQAGVLRMHETGAPHRREKRYLRKDGSVVWVRVSVAPVQVPGLPPTTQVAVVQDVTEARLAEQQFHQAQKLESIGRLAGGVAHDFNNLLTAIQSCVTALREDLAAGRPAQAGDVEEIGDAARRAVELTRQLLAFARKHEVAPAPLDLNEVVRGSQKLLRRLLGDGVRLQLSPQPGLWPVLADRGQLEQVLVNLAVNARDAMPAGGTLAVETANAEVGPGEAAADPHLQPGQWVRLTVRDTGTGMAPEVRQHLFEPFFTTKAEGKGTGLGLATVYGIVRQAGGHVHVESAPGQGTAIQVCLPRWGGGGS